MHQLISLVNFVSTLSLRVTARAGWFFFSEEYFSKKKGFFSAEIIFCHRKKRSPEVIFFMIIYGNNTYQLVCMLFYKPICWLCYPKQILDLLAYSNYYLNFKNWISKNFLKAMIESSRSSTAYSYSLAQLRLYHDKEKESQHPSFSSVLTMRETWIRAPDYLHVQIKSTHPFIRCNSSKQ